MDQAQEAEHVVLALEGENATIGEYIALYHQRRSALHDRFKEKDDFIDRLLGEREQLKVGGPFSHLWSRPRTAAVLSDMRWHWVFPQCNITVYGHQVNGRVVP